MNHANVKHGGKGDFPVITYVEGSFHVGDGNVYASSTS